MMLHLLFIVVAIMGFVLAFSGILKFMRVLDVPIIQRLKVIDQTARFSVEKEGRYIIGIDDALLIRSGIIFRTRIWSVDSTNNLPNYIYPVIHSVLGYSSNVFFFLHLYDLPIAGDYYIELYGTEKTKFYNRSFRLVDNKKLSLIIKSEVPILTRIRMISLIVFGTIIMLFGIILSVNPFLFN